MFLFIMSKCYYKINKTLFTSLYKAKFLTYPTDVPLNASRLYIEKLGDSVKR